jgi:hypothetical protein
MKKFLAILLVMVSVQVFAQDNVISAITITIPTNPDANTGNWGTGKSVFIISATAQSATGRIDPAVEESKLLVVIKKGGNTVCGAYTGSTAPAADFNTMTKVWSGSNAASFLGKDCTLAPGDYEVSVQFFGYNNGKYIPLSDEKTKLFTIKGNDQQAYQPPQAIAPANGTSFAEADIKKPITFRWTPVIPKPQDAITYRLSVWQLMVGQTGAQAMKANTPIITKDVDNITQAVLNNLVSGPCDPPMICDFIWTVQALDREGKPVGGNNGTSGANEFNIAGEAQVKNPDEPGTYTWGGCNRHNTTWPDIANVLNTVSNCAVPFNGCYYTQTVTTNPGDTAIWGGSMTHVFSAAEQNSLIAIAYQWAMNHRPPGCNNSLKSIVSIKYSTEVLVGDDEVNDKALTFSVEYGCCTHIIINRNYQTRVDLVSPIMNLNKGEDRPTFQWVVDNTLPGQTYSLKVVEIREKQSPEDAIKSNAPILEQSAIKEPAFPYPPTIKPVIPGKLYAWFVTVSDGRGKQVGVSSIAQFSMGSCDVNLNMKLLSVTCLPATKGNNNYKICVAATYSSSIYNLTYANTGSGFKAYAPSYSPTYSVSNITPSLQVQNSGPVTTLNYCIDVSVPAGQTAIKVGLQGDDKDPGPIVCQPGAELDVTLPPCACTICDQYKDWSFSNENVSATTAAPYTVNVDATFNAPNVIIKSFKAELISFVHNGTEACFGCNKDAETFGNFTKGKFASWGYGVFPLDGTNTTHHTLTWFSATGATVNLSGQPISIQFTAPPISPLSCCDDQIDFCIRYSFTDADCRTCSYVKCYTVKRKH